MSSQDLRSDLIDKCYAGLARNLFVAWVAWKTGISLSYAARKYGSEQVGSFWMGFAWHLAKMADKGFADTMSGALGAAQENSSPVN